MSKFTKEKHEMSKVKLLEEYIDSFPKDHPSRAVPLRETAKEEAIGHRPETTKEFDLRKYEREATTKRQGREAMKQSLESVRRQKIDKWVQLAEKNNSRLEKENDALAKIAVLMQENAINNDERYNEAINAARVQLEYTTLSRQEYGGTMSRLNETTALIQDKIATMVRVSLHQTEVEYNNIRQVFEKQVEQRVEELARERQNGSSTTQEWESKNEVLQREVEALILQTDTAYTLNKKLHEQNRHLQVEHDAQADDATVLERQYRHHSAQFQQLKDRIHDLEMELASDIPSPEHRPASKQQSQKDTDVGLDATARPTSRPSHRLSSTAAEKIQGLLEVEMQNLRAVRHAHLAALRQRSELEVYLLHSIRRLRSLKRQTVGSDTTAFTAEDRRQVVDHMLSQPRVVALLYEEGASPDSVAPAHEEDTAQSVEALWNRWKQWSADAAAPSPPQEE